MLEQCRRHALAVHEPYGVWGGLSEAERDEIIRGRTRRLRVTGRRCTALPDRAGADRAVDTPVRADPRSARPHRTGA